MQSTANVVPFRTPSDARDEAHSTDTSTKQPRNEWRMHGDWPADQQDKGRPIGDPVAVLGITRQLARVWRAYLTDPEYILLDHIIDQTIGWQKSFARFTHRRLAEGNGFTCGTGQSETQARQHLHSLEAKGFIDVDRSEPFRGMQIWPNIDWVPQAHIRPIRGKAKTQEESAIAATVPSAPAVASDAAPMQVRMRKRPTVTVAAIAPPVDEIERTLCRAFSASDLCYDAARDRAINWKYDRRLALARQIVNIWSSEDAKNWPDSTADICQEFSCWLVAVWPQIAPSVGPGALGYPDVRFIYSNKEWLLSQFRSHRYGARG